jgi:hypothetical protein
MELIEKIKTVLQVAVRDDNNKLSIPDGYVFWYFSEDPDAPVIKEKSEKIVHLINEAEQRNDVEYLNRDLDEVINNLLDL